MAQLSETGYCHAMPKNVIIVGMARSGTSLTASMFAKQGYFVADDPDSELEGPNKFNQIGRASCRERV